MNITLKNVRLSFPKLFKPESISGSEPKYGASFILNKVEDAAQIDALRNACKAVAQEKWPRGIPKGVKYCVHDGSEKEYDGYGEEVIYVSASATIRPAVVDQRRAPLTADDGKPYAGCFVNASIRLWAQDNEFGKRINAQLRGVQFSRDGEAFGEKPFDPESEFTDLESGSEERPQHATAEAGKPEVPEDDIPF